MEEASEYQFHLFRESAENPNEEFEEPKVKGLDKELLAITREKIREEAKQKEIEDL